MEAIVRADGRQLRLTEGQEIEMNRVEGDVGDTVTFNDVLCVLDGTDVTVRHADRWRRFRPGSHYAARTSAEDPLYEVQEQGSLPPHVWPSPVRDAPGGRIDFEELNQWPTKKA